VVIFDDEEERQEHGLRFEGRLHKLVSGRNKTFLSSSRGHVACFAAKSVTFHSVFVCS